MKNYITIFFIIATLSIPSSPILALSPLAKPLSKKNSAILFAFSVGCALIKNKLWDYHTSLSKNKNSTSALNTRNDVSLYLDLSKY